MPKAEETRALIIEKTASLFNKQGYAGTSLSDMEKATGLTKGSIYNNFANKDEVALAAFDYNLGKVNSLIQSEMEKAGTAREKLLVYVRVYSDAIFKSSFPSGGCPMLNTAIDADDTHPALRKRAQAAIIGWKNKIGEVVRNGIQVNEFDAAVDPEEVALTLVATIEGGIMIAKVTGKAAFLKTIMKSVEKFIYAIA